VKGIRGRPAHAIVATRDLDRALAFYSGVLGLTVIENDAYGCFLEAGGTEVRLSVVEDHEPSGLPVLGWLVPDVAATVAALAAAGFPAERFEGLGQDDAGVWTGPDGARLAWFRDPDGNLLSMVEDTRR
jgi:catechol 2,3-dioxygenase-like lactoylglutathione lyase family enzyme